MMEQQASNFWALARGGLPERWPKGPDGKPETGAVLTRARSELGGSADILIALLDSCGILGQQEIGGTKKVLTAAALTYVASLAASILQLLRLLILAGGRRRND